ncbi:MAG: selenocysteine lyase [Ignavibacteriae bacterium HGW-Ignavibacteriae-1]|jgi:selenocysteine lyase/cysteine desulfurase|nr:MAG: selenocysteine lyase [Ignavibacteriae bacterium HGW-Ignavibacteriae-1]
MTQLEEHFLKFRNNISGIDTQFESPYGTKKLLYADWTATGRVYLPIEKFLIEEISPFVANTHSFNSFTGSTTTLAYKMALKYIKRHVGAYDSDVIISAYSGMTGVVNKFQRMLGFRIHESYSDLINKTLEEKPIIFVTHMEHHSNQTSWLETIVDVEIIRPDNEGLPDLGHLAEMLEKYSARKTKIAAITSCSNVTGIFTPYHDIAEMMHKAGGLCFVDFATSAPYIDIKMRQDNPERSLDAIYFSPHKFLGGPGSTGILVFDPKLYHNKIPDLSGGGIVKWTNPWGEHEYFDDIETREDCGTPAVLQTIKAAFAIKLKEEMGVRNILAREHEIIQIIFDRLSKIPNLKILASNKQERLGIISFCIVDFHYNLVVSLLNDKFGIQVRGGCSCAGTYGHYLLDVNYDQSHSFSNRIKRGDYSEKPGWARLSIHPTMSDTEIEYICDAIKEVALNISEWQNDYEYDAQINDFLPKNHFNSQKTLVTEWFNRKLN